MFSDLEPYQDLKESGIAWLGRIPTHWDVRRNGRLFAQRNETGYPDLPILEVSLRTGVRLRDFDNSTRKQIMSDMQKYKRARAGDIAYNMMRMWQGAVGVAPVDGLISPAYVVAKPFPETCSRYYEYLFRTAAYMNEVNKFSRGIVSDRNRLYWEDFKQIPSPYPPPEEQAAIVRFLDYIDRRVRRYIRAKRELVALLNEQKQAIIHRAVTCGLDPNVRRKPSGVPWLSDVPNNWDLLPLKRVAKIQTGITLGKRYESQKLQDRPYLRVANVQTGRVDLRVVKTVAVPTLEAVGAELMAGDVLMTEGGDIDKLGRGCVWRGEIEHCLHQNHVFAVRPKVTRMIPDYLVLLMASRHGRFYFETTAKRTTNLASTNSTTIGAFPLALPPIVEQQEILTIVKQNTAALDVASENTQQEIALLWDYRTRIVFALVSGRLDIRDAIAMLPDEADDEAPADDVAVDDNRLLDDEDSDDAAHEEIEA